MDVIEYSTHNSAGKEWWENEGQALWVSPYFKITPENRTMIWERDERLHYQVMGLPLTQRRIVEMRFGLSQQGPKTLREIGDQLGLSAEGVRKAPMRALNRLRFSLRDFSEDN